ncbi:MAG: DUF47 domain-containing protein [Xanthobacteraceae bacterium]
MLRWFQALLPHEDLFFDLFARHSEAVLAGAKALRDMLDGGDVVSQCYRTVMDREHEADVITRDVLVAVRRTFITPFDRGAVKDLITSMDNTIDQMQKTAKTIMLFDQRTFTTQQRAMADAVVSCAGLVREAAPLLAAMSTNAGRLSEISEELSQIEGRTDELHDAGLQELYRANQPSNSMAFFIGVEIYDHLEKVVDRFDDVGNEVSGVVIEHV